MEAIVSIGYEGRELEGFVEVLRSSGVDLLVDVRLTPISRKPGFSKRALADALTSKGMKYRHVPQLGNPKENRPASKMGRWRRENGGTWSTSMAQHDLLMRS